MNAHDTLLGEQYNDLFLSFLEHLADGCSLLEGEQASDAGQPPHPQPAPAPPCSAPVDSTPCAAEEAQFHHGMFDSNLEVRQSAILAPTEPSVDATPLAALPSREETRQQRIRAKNPRNQKAYREQLKVTSLCALSGVFRSSALRVPAFARILLAAALVDANKVLQPKPDYDVLKYT